MPNYHKLTLRTAGTNNPTFDQFFPEMSDGSFLGLELFLKNQSQFEIITDHGVVDIPTGVPPNPITPAGGGLTSAQEAAIAANTAHANDTALHEHLDPTLLEKIANKTATIRAIGSADDTRYPTEKAVRDAIDSIPNQVTAQETKQSEVSNGAGSSIGPVRSTFTPEISGNYIFNYFGDVVSGTGGISVGISIGTSDLFVSSPATGETDGARITALRNSNFSPPIALEAGVTYFVEQWAGGGGLVNNHTVKILLEADNAETDFCGINEYVHNLYDYYLAISHEGDGGTNMSVNINGVPATYTNLNKASDNGNGQVNFNGGVNGNYDRRARVVESIKKVGDYIEITKPSTPPYDSEWVSISNDPAGIAHTVTNSYKILFTQSNFSLRDKANTNILTQGNEVGVYRITRTLYGFRFEKNGVLLYETAETCTNYEPDYINSEFFTGKKWIDNKEIFRQVIKAALPNAATIYHALKTDAGIDMPATGYLNEIVKIDFVAAQNAGDNVFLNQNGLEDIGVSDNGAVKSVFAVAASNFSGYTGTWIVEYTKV